MKNVKQEVDPYELISKADVDLQKLNEIFKSVMRKQVDKVDPIRSKFKEIEREEISLEEKMAEVREEVRGLEGINFRTLLELMKIGAIAIRQEDIFGEIIIDSLDTI